MKFLIIPKRKCCAKVGGIYHSNASMGKGVGKQIYKRAESPPSRGEFSENVSVVPIQPAKQMDMSRIARVLAETSISKRGNRKVRL